MGTSHGEKIPEDRPSPDELIQESEGIKQRKMSREEMAESGQLCSPDKLQGAGDYVEEWDNEVGGEFS